MCILYPIKCDNITIYTGINRLEKISLIYNINNINLKENKIVTTVKEANSQIDKIQKDIKRIDTPIAADIRLFLNEIKTKINCFKTDKTIEVVSKEISNEIIREIEIVPSFIDMIKEKKYRVSKTKSLYNKDKYEFDMMLTSCFKETFNVHILLVEDLKDKIENNIVYNYVPLFIKINNKDTFLKKIEENPQIQLINQYYSTNSNNEQFIICDYIINKGEV